LEPNKITPGKRTGWQLEPEAQDLIDLAGIEEGIEVGKTRLLTTRLPRDHGQIESGGPTNDLHGGLRH
jgi:hypothetical protein